MIEVIMKGKAKEIAVYVLIKAGEDMESHVELGLWVFLYPQE
jgi:hypothetical protein